MSSDKNGVQAELAEYASVEESRLLPSFDQPYYMPCLQNKVNSERDGFFP